MASDPGGPISEAGRKRPTGCGVRSFAAAKAARKPCARRSDAALPGEFGFPSAASHRPAALCHPGARPTAPVHRAWTIFG